MSREAQVRICERIGCNPRPYSAAMVATNPIKE